MPRLLLLCEYATLNGGERSMLATLDGVAAAGFRAAVAAPPQGPLARVLHARGIEHVPWDVRDAAGVRPPQQRLREDLTGLLTRVRPDVLHANSLSMGRLSGPVAAAMGVPSIAHLRDIVRVSRRAIVDLQCHRRLLAVSQAVLDYHAGQVARSLRDRPAVARSLRDRGSGSRSDPATLASGLGVGKLHVLHNGVDLEEFCPRGPTGYLHGQLGLPHGALLAATIGQIGLRKGQDVLARAALMLADELPGLHWLMVGERHSAKHEARRFEADLHRAAERLPGRLHFLGWRDDVPRLLNELTMLVHPARQEPLGRVLLEAAASGVAVVATDVGGTREIFPPASDAAVLVPPDDPKALSDAVRRMAADPGQRRRMGDAARRRAVEAFDVLRAVARLGEHYREAIVMG